MRSVDDTKLSMIVMKKHDEIRTQDHMIKWESLRDPSKLRFSRG